MFSFFSRSVYGLAHKWAKRRLCVLCASSSVLKMFIDFRPSLHFLSYHLSAKHARTAAFCSRVLLTFCDSFPALRLSRALCQYCRLHFSFPQSSILVPFSSRVTLILGNPSGVGFPSSGSPYDPARVHSQALSTAIALPQFRLVFPPELWKKNNH